MSAEEWRPVADFPGYEVSNEGRVRSSRRGGLRILSPSPSCPEKPYLRVTLQRDGSQYYRMVHLLVAHAFVGPRPDGMVTRHLDGNCQNNTPENLRYGTVAENARDMLRHGTHNQRSKTHCPSGHPYDSENTHFSRLGHRKCRACMQAATDARSERRRLRRLRAEWSSA